jgi:aspartate aminotransferase
MAISDNIAERMARGAWIRQMFEEGAMLIERFGAENVFDLSLGNPVLEPPIEFSQELKRIVDSSVPGMHKYMLNIGYEETRASVASQLLKETGIQFTSNEIIMSCGAAGALNVILKTILNHGDEVIVFVPFFAEYDNYINSHNGILKLLPTDDKFIPRLDTLDSEITKKTKAIIINSPNNPTGVVYDTAFLKQLGDILQRKEKQYNTQIYLISDEAYKRIIYDGLTFPPVITCHPNTIIAASHSKDLSLPGERIGYIAVHPECAPHDELLAGVNFCTRVLYVNAPALMQLAIRNLQYLSVSTDEYQKKRDFIYNNLVNMGYSVIKPQGAFYLFPKSLVEDDVAFVKELIQYNVITVPGRGFGTPGYFRIAYSVDDRTLEGSLDGFRKIAEKMGKH